MGWRGERPSRCAGPASELTSSGDQHRPGACHRDERGRTREEGLWPEGNERPRHGAESGPADRPQHPGRGPSSAGHGEGDKTAQRQFPRPRREREKRPRLIRVRQGDAHPKGEGPEDRQDSDRRPASQVRRRAPVAAASAGR